MEQLYKYITGIKYGSIRKYWNSYVTYNHGDGTWLVYASKYDVVTDRDILCVATEDWEYAKYWEYSIKQQLVT